MVPVQSRLSGLLTIARSLWRWFEYNCRMSCRVPTAHVPSTPGAQVPEIRTSQYTSSTTSSFRQLKHSSAATRQLPNTSPIPYQLTASNCVSPLGSVLLSGVSNPKDCVFYSGSKGRFRSCRLDNRRLLSRQHNRAY